MSNFAVIVAGGKGRRMQTEENKCFLSLAGKEILVWTIDAFKKSGVVEGIVCVLGDQEEVDEARNLIKKHNMKDSVKALVPTGGPERQDGVWSGIEALRALSVKAEDIILVHNGANPLVKTSEIKSCIEAAESHGASVSAMRVKDTIKKVGDDLFVTETLVRKELWAMQTPQTMKYSVAVEAFERAFADGFYGTDDVQLVERIGGKVKIVECSYENFKLTTPEDMLLAEKILKKRSLNI